MSRQFINDENIDLCLREMNELMKKWKLRPLERDIVIQICQKREKEMQMSAKSSEMMNIGIGKIKERFGL